MTLNVQSVLAGARELGLLLSEQQGERLVSFGKLLMQWNKVYNLTRIESEEAVLNLHILDSLAFVAAIAKRHLSTVLDIGSGGGLPAIPLSVVRPDVQVTMVDSVQKKTVFLQQAILKLGLTNARVVHSRIEDFPNERFHAVTCRAFATLSKTVSLTRRLLDDDGVWLLMKGKDPVGEIEALDSDICVEENRKLSVPGTDLVRCLIVLRVNRTREISV